MTALVFFLFSLLIPNVWSCLVIRYVEPPKCNCPVLALDNSNIKSHVADHPFYSNISSRPIKAPIVSIDECYGSVYCEGDYNLVVFDTETATNFGEYAADGLCDRYTQTWLVDDMSSGGFTTFQRLYATCVDFTEYDSCNQSDQHPLLFAYSNDLDPSIPIEVFSLYPWFSTMAHVRFDTQQEEPIEYYKTEYPDYYGNEGAWKDGVRNRLPDPSLSFKSNETGSDVLKVIERFLDNTEYPLCGTKMIILMKRWPNEVNIERLVQKLRRSRTLIYIFASTSPSGGYQKNILYNLAAQTNGLCLFDDTDERMILAIRYINPYHKRPLVYAVNRQVSGQGTMELPPMTFDGYYMSISFQDTVKSFPYSHATLRWGNNGSTADDKRLSYGGAEHGIYGANIRPGIDKIWLEYNYSDDKVRTIQIRIVTDDFVDDWVPYDN